MKSEIWQYAIYDKFSYVVVYFFLESSFTTQFTYNDEYLPKKSLFFEIKLASNTRF